MISESKDPRFRIFYIFYHNKSVERIEFLNTLNIPLAQLTDPEIQDPTQHNTR